MFGRSAARADYIIYAVCAIGVGLTAVAKLIEKWDEWRWASVPYVASEQGKCLG